LCRRSSHNDSSRASFSAVFIPRTASITTISHG
jgi:hypothetical protein